LDPPQPKRQAGSWVVALYEGEWFLCEVMADQEGVASGYTKLSYMAIKGKNVFSWGDKPDLVDTLEEDIILDKVEPVPVNSRGHLQLNTLDFVRVLSRMVVILLWCVCFFLIFRNR